MKEWPPSIWPIGYGNVLLGSGYDGQAGVLMMLAIPDDMLGEEAGTPTDWNIFQEAWDRRGPRVALQFKNKAAVDLLIDQLEHIKKAMKE